MLVIVTLVTIMQSFAISLGVGSSTIAIINFFVAIADGVIDERERQMMGVVYIVLRVAMVAILLTTVFLVVQEYTSAIVPTISTLSTAQLITLCVLFLNAGLMTAHKISSTFGPAIQAGSWYALGALLALSSVQVTSFTVFEFLLAYFTWIVLAIGIVNGVMAALNIKKHHRRHL